MTYQADGVSIQVENGGSNPWEAQIAYKNITLEQGVTYKLSFDYFATDGVSSDCNVMQNHDSYMPYHTVGLQYTLEVQHMESEFTMTSATDKNSEIAFNCGGKSMKPCTITISNLSLVRVSESNAEQKKLSRKRKGATKAAPFYISIPCLVLTMPKHRKSLLNRFPSKLNLTAKRKG